MNSATVARVLDSELWPLDFVTCFRYGVRKWKDRPAFAIGDKVTILKAKYVSDNYGTYRHVLVRSDDGRERWVEATKLYSTMGGSAE